ncbi:MAG: putative sulfate exporter family transporter, partial [Terriglobales bacterium]
MANTKNIFFVGLVVAASGLISTPLALLAGLIYGLSFEHPYHVDARKLSAFLLQASIVALGFGMNLHEVIRAGRNGFVDTAISITFAMLMGLAIGRLFHVQN